MVRFYEELLAGGWHYITIINWIYWSFIGLGKEYGNIESVGAHAFMCVRACVPVGGVCVGGYAFICISREIRPRKYDRVTILLSDRELFTRKILSRNWIAFISLFKVYTSLFASISKESVCTFSEGVQVLHLQSHGRCFLPVPWFSSSQWVLVKTERKCFHPAHPLWRALPNPFPSNLEQRSPHRCPQGHLGMSSLLFLFSLLCYSTLNFQLNRNAHGHRSI